MKTYSFFYKKPLMPRWYFNDTSMILFCKESRKVSSSQLIELVNFRFFDKPENDTMTLFRPVKVYNDKWTCTMLHRGYATDIFHKESQWKVVHTHANYCCYILWFQAFALSLQKEITWNGDDNQGFMSTYCPQKGFLSTQNVVFQ